MQQVYSVVPIRIEGLFLSSDKQVTSPLADFSKLPFKDGDGDKNFSQPYVADGIIHEPFSDANLLLEKGFHIHFIIPHYLGQHVPQKCGISLSGQIPPAPNRWLITKKTNNTIVKQWLLESDYIHSDSYNPSEAQCTIPFNQGQPYRYMGRKTLLTDTRTQGDTFKSISGKPLTVLGYGDINFSSFYPNCLGVFGFYDGDAELDGTTYAILGWNDDPNDDLLNAILTNLYKNNPAVDLENINKQLSDLFKIKIDPNSNTLDSSNIPRSIFYGEIVADNNNPEKLDTSTLQLAIGNTGTEALSALLANTYSTDPTDKVTIEEQLESVLLNTQLEHLLTDFGPKFLEARHEKGFRAVHAGNIWKLTIDNSQNNRTGNDAGIGSNGAATDSNYLFNTSALPVDLAQLLNELNLAQQAYDKAINDIIDLKEQLYADWNKYMYSRYPPLGTRGARLDADHVMYFIQNYSFTELDTLMSSTGTITYGEPSNAFCPTPSNPTSKDLANALATKWTAVNIFLVTENAKRLSAKQKAIQLVFSVAPAFYSATPPAVLISGLDNGSMDDYNAKPVVTSAKLLSSNQSLNEQSIATNNTGDILTQLVGQSLNTLSSQKYNPFILDWELDLQHTKIHDSNNAILAEAIKSNFVVNQFGSDLQKANYSSGKLSVISGSVLLSSHAGVSILKQIENFIRTHFSKKGISYKSNADVTNFLDAESWSDAYNLLVLPTNYTAINANKDFTNNPIYTIWKAYKTLLTKNVLSQTLSGFNEAFLCVLMRVPVW